MVELVWKASCINSGEASGKLPMIQTAQPKEELDDSGFITEGRVVLDDKRVSVI